ncbi:MAG: Mur ligase family protein [Gemmatimonadota bacterium]|nr:Mur ligase family protein [Gemmatimonadota bacterium]
MEVRDSRRLTGPNIVTDGPAAILDIIVEEGDDPQVAVAVWTRHVTDVLAAVGWADAPLSHRIFHGGLSLAFRAPIDSLYAATEVNEWAWEASEADLSGVDPAENLQSASARLRAEIDREANPRVLELEHAAARHGVAFLWDDDHVSVGLGTGSLTWPALGIPPIDEIPWDLVHDVPVAQVTGTNGKTTTVRLIGAMVRAAGKVPGISSTDWIAAGDAVLDHGDYSGPGGARQVLRHPRVECAVLETARGGMLRRGLALERTDVALVNNVAADHLGEFGVHDLDALAECKFVVARAARHLVLNADDPVVRSHAGAQSVPITWFTLDATDPLVVEHIAAGGKACALERGRLVLSAEGQKLAIAEVADVPVTLGGAARHNVANALAAIGVAVELGLNPRAIGDGLRGFESTPEVNPGRLNEFEISGARFIVDFAHNPHGMDALLEMAAALPARRRLITLGQAGDRDDEAIRALARATWKATPDRVLIKAMTQYLRGREEGEIPAVLESELRAAGATDDHLQHTGSEVETARAAVEWAREGDLVLLITHAERDQVIAFLRELAGAPQA